MARARTSLPVPVSPEEQDGGVGRGDAVEDAEDAPHRRPLTDGALELRALVGLDLEQIEVRPSAISTLPARTTLPTGAIASDTRALSTNVPLVDPPSHTRTPPGALSSVQWWRETLSSGRTRSLSGAFPTRKVPRSGTLVPFFSPESTTTEICTTAPSMGGVDVDWMVASSSWSGFGRRGGKAGGP